MTVGRRTCDRLGCERTAGAWSIFDDKLLNKYVAEALRHDARDAVGISAGRKGNDNPDRPARPVLRLCGQGPTESDKSGEYCRKHIPRLHNDVPIEGFPYGLRILPHVLIETPDLLC